MLKHTIIRAKHILRYIASLPLRAIIFALLFSLLARKILLGLQAMRFVHEFRGQVLSTQMLEDKNFRQIAEELSAEDPTLILILNRHTLNMTFNWLCNTQHMPGVHESSLIVTLDRESSVQLEHRWPKVRRLNWIVPALRDPFNYGDGKYQLLYLLRANLALAMLSLGKPFWMIQQDTFWRGDLRALNLAEFKTNNDVADVIFDRGTKSNGYLIAGGYFRVRATDGALKYFQRLAQDLEKYYVPDNVYMTALCSEPHFKCGYIPFNVVTNWIWLFERAGNSDDSICDEISPTLLQFDGDTKLGEKLAKMRELGFYFLGDDGHSCNAFAVQKASEIVAGYGRQSVAQTHNLESFVDGNYSMGVEFSAKLAHWRSYSHWQFDLYQNIVGLFYKTRFTETFLNRIIFPYAHYFMITL